MQQKIGGHRVCYEAFGVSLSKTALGADLGGSSKYSNESFEDLSGEGFHVNSRFALLFALPALQNSYVSDWLLRGTVEMVVCLACYNLSFWK